MNRLSVKSSVLILTGLLCFASNSYAENADRSKPINLESDNGIVDDANKISTFNGNVKLTQGTLKITAEKLIVVQANDGFSVSTATGDLASFKQKREGADEFIEGYAETIIYDTRNELVDLRGKAHIKRTADEVRGDHITYNTRTEVFQVLSKPNVDLTSVNKDRVRAVIQPKNKETSPQGKP
jgi:lipopolysaccharide export system protein LptA